jgi:hypothetical protein
VGYFDALITSSYFKTAPDGRKLFFPWSTSGRGYTIASEQDFPRLRRQVKVYVVISLVVVVVGLLVMGAGSASASLERYFAASVIGALPIGFYMVWLRYWLHRLQPSEERLSVQESVASLARTHKAVVEIVVLAFVGFLILISIFDPGSRLFALASIFLLGLCAA